MAENQAVYPVPFNKMEITREVKIKEPKGKSKGGFKTLSDNTDVSSRSLD